MFTFCLINIFLYLIILKVNYFYFKQKMYFPFRLAEISAFFITNIISLIIMLFFFKLQVILIVLFINCLLSYSLYHIANMIQTSPRTKILLDVYYFKSIQKTDYLKIYNLDIILENRLQRFISSKQIKINQESIRLNIKKSFFIEIVFKIFKFMKYL